jgi:DNA-binding NarL/FixJ family response regulator
MEPHATATIEETGTQRVLARKKAISPATGAAEVVVRLMCVDDHALLVQGMKVQAELDPGIDFVAGLPDPSRLLDEVARVQPDVVTLDVEMPGPDVFEAADRLRHRFPDVRFAFLSAHVRDTLLSAAYRCGASGYFAKGDDLRDILDGLKRIARSKRGTFVMGPKVMAQCPAARAVRSARRTRRAAKDGEQVFSAIDRLSSREIEVLRCIGNGMSRVEIGKSLSRSPKTIDGHQERIMRKLGIETRNELMRWAIREGIASA